MVSMNSISGNWATRQKKRRGVRQTFGSWCLTQHRWGVRGMSNHRRSTRLSICASTAW